ncbi:MAG: sodium:proton antiporter, partial [Desulfosarcinaceae bacterium]
MTLRSAGRSIGLSGFIVMIVFICLVGNSYANTPGPDTSHGAGSPAEMPSGSSGHAAEGHAGGHEGSNLGSELPLWSCLPFAFMLLSIALWPLVAPEFWHHHFGKISALWAATMAVPFIFVYKGLAVYEILHILLADYVPFIILLWSLYTVSGGILLRGTLRGTPVVNVIMLIIGTFLASWMGTTGAAMLMIRPFLRANKERKNRTFMVVFFIFLVANVGGSLTPLGDPPLFLGFLHGVDFFWTFHILPHMLSVTVLLLLVYFIMDTYYYRKEKKEALAKKTDAVVSQVEDNVRLALDGKVNFLFLAGI